MSRVRFVRQFEISYIRIHYGSTFKSYVNFSTKLNCSSQGLHLTLPKVEKPDTGTEAGQSWLDLDYIFVYKNHEYCWLAVLRNEKMNQLVYLFMSSTMITQDTGCTGQIRQNIFFSRQLIEAEINSL